MRARDQPRGSPLHHRDRRDMLHKCCLHRQTKYVRSHGRNFGTHETASHSRQQCAAAQQKHERKHSTRAQKHSLHSSGPRKPSRKERRCQTWEPNLTGVNRGIELNRTAHPNMETKTQKKWYHLTPVPPASNGVKGAVTREQVAKTSDVH